MTILADIPQKLTAKEAKELKKTLVKHLVLASIINRVELWGSGHATKIEKVWNVPKRMGIWGRIGTVREVWYEIKSGIYNRLELWSFPTS